MAQPGTEPTRPQAPSSPDQSPNGEGRRLVLASEALREDLAPLEPNKRSARLIYGGVACSLALLGLALRQGLGAPEGPVDTASVAFGTAGAIAAVAALPFPYAVRAATGLVLGLGMMGLGAQGIGPTAGLDTGNTAFEAARLLTMSVLPAALLFRARYRAYRPARLLLAGALLVSLPFVLIQGFLATDIATEAVMRGGAIAAILAVACGLFGFMGKDTTGAGSVWAAVVIGALSAEIALGDLTGSTASLGQSATAIGTACAAVMVSLGLYQLLAARLAEDARRASMKKDPDAETSPA